MYTLSDSIRNDDLDQKKERKCLLIFFTSHFRVNVSEDGKS